MRQTADAVIADVVDVGCRGFIPRMQRSALLMCKHSLVFDDFIKSYARVHLRLFIIPSLELERIHTHTHTRKQERTNGDLGSQKRNQQQLFNMQGRLTH